MGLLSSEQVQEFRHLHGHTFLAGCDGPCGKLIPCTDLYMVRSWGRRKDGLTFLGAEPRDIECLTCYKIRVGIIKVKDDLPVTEKEEKARPEKPTVKKKDIPSVLRSAALSVFKRHPTKKGYETAEMISFMRRRSAVREQYGKGDCTRALQNMKRCRLIKKTDGRWITFA